MRNYKGLKDKCWKGRFSVPDTEFTFFANLTYSLSNGITLEAMHIDKNEKLLNFLKNNKILILHGILDDSKDCTLYGHFKPIKHTKYGQNDVVNTTFRVDKILAGKRVNHSSKFIAAQFSITGLNEFYSVESIKKLPYPSKLKSSGCQIEIHDRFNVSTYRLSDVIPERHRDELKKLLESDTDYNNIEDNKISFNFKDNKSKSIILHYEKAANIDRISNDINQLTHLVAFLTDNPQLHYEISVFEENNKCELDLLFSQVRHEDTLKLIDDFHKSIIEVNALTINFTKVALNWLNNKYDMTVLSVIVQFRLKWINKRDIYGNFLLQCSQLEFMNSQLDGENGSKYLTPIEYYASNIITEKLKNFFLKKSDCDIGKSISKIRAGITHPTRKNIDFLKKFEVDDIYDLTIILFSIVMSKYFIDSGIEEKVTHNYQYQLGIRLLW